jgi:cytochrome c-type biogenesis protein CcmH
VTVLVFAGLAALILAPLAHALLRPVRAIGRGEADRALYEAQLAELEVQRAQGRLDEAAHRAATVEVQRRLLAAPPALPVAPPSRSPGLILVVAAMVPLAGLGLYLWRGTPDMPSAPYAIRAEANRQEDVLLNQLRERLARADPATEIGRQGFLLLGNAERNRGNWAEAAAAWTRVLEARFDVGTASDLAEVEIERGEVANAQRWLAMALARQPGDPRLRFLMGLADARAGRVDEARTAWRALLAEAPPGAPWREVVEARLRSLP